MSQFMDASIKIAYYALRSYEATRGKLEQREASKATRQQRM